VRAIETAIAHGKPIQNWVRFVSIMDEDMECEAEEQAVFAAEILRLVNHTARLETIDIETGAAAEVITCLTQRAAGSLRKLTLSCWADQPPFSHVPVGALESLTKLTLYMLEADWHREDPLFTPCTLPRLTHLYWNGYPLTGFPAFLASSSFPALTNVDISNLAPLSTLGAEQLRTFFRGHALRELGLVLATDAEFPLILPAVRADTVMMMSGSVFWIPPPEAAAHLPPSTTTIKVHADADGARLWAFLDEIWTAGACHAKTITVLTQGPGRFFAWIPFEQDTAECAFLGKLLIHAAKLARRGIAIRDYEDRTVLDWFPKP
jgi:hypothetical protein